LGARLLRELGIEPELVKGDRGVFDVTVDGTLVLSKHKAGRFPDEAALVESIRGLERR
jgi:selT/selW/selH-like putative selenoprotein